MMCIICNELLFAWVSLLWEHCMCTGSIKAGATTPFQLVQTMNRYMTRQSYPGA